MYGWSSNVGASPRATLGGDMIPTAANNWTGSNYIAFDDPTMNADIAKAETELDPGKQKVIWAEMQKIYAEQVPRAAAVLPGRAARGAEMAEGLRRRPAMAT